MQPGLLHEYTLKASVAEHHRPREHGQSVLRLLLARLLGWVTP